MRVGGFRRFLRDSNSQRRLDSGITARVNRMPNPRSLSGAMPALAACALVLAALAVAGTALADPQTPEKPKPSSFAPHHTRSHVYGAPIQKPLVHKRKKRKAPATPAPVEPIK